MKESSTVKPQDGNLDRERLTSLINSMADAVIAIDEQMHVVLYNGAALNILDVNGTITGKNLGKILFLIDKNGIALDLQQIVAQTKIQTTSREWRIKYPDGSTVNLYSSIAPVRLGYGQKGMSGHVLLLRDITREKSLEEERDEFISVVSHELRTPIAITEGNIGNASFILEKTGDIGAVKSALAQAHDQVTFLSSLINDLSTLSRAEKGKLETEIEPINPHELLLELEKIYSPDANSKGLKLLIDTDPRLELLHSSRLYVREILQNFITNAIKYTDEGSVTIGAQKQNTGVLFTITDTGIGISKADKERVFDKFFRSEDYHTRQHSGTGLGLYVTMKLARLIHAEIDLYSKLGHGSTFSILIPNLDISKLSPQKQP